MHTSEPAVRNLLNESLDLDAYLGLPERIAGSHNNPECIDSTEKSQRDVKLILQQMDSSTRQQEATRLQFERDMAEKDLLEKKLREDRERVDAERLEAVRLERIRVDREHELLIIAEREKAEAARIEAVRQERERLLEQQRQEIARLEALREERARNEQMHEDALRREREAAEILRLQAIKEERERAEVARLEAVRLEKELGEARRLQAVKEERERGEKLQQEALRIEREKAELQRVEQESRDLALQLQRETTSRLRALQLASEQQQEERLRRAALLAAEEQERAAALEREEKERIEREAAEQRALELIRKQREDAAAVAEAGRLLALKKEVQLRLMKKEKLRQENAIRGKKNAARLASAPSSAPPMIISSVESSSAPEPDEGLRSAAQQADAMVVSPVMEKKSNHRGVLAVLIGVLLLLVAFSVPLLGSFGKQAARTDFLAVGPPTTYVQPLPSIFEESMSVEFLSLDAVDHAMDIEIFDNETTETAPVIPIDTGLELKEQLIYRRRWGFRKALLLLVKLPFRVAKHVVIFSFGLA